MPRIPILAITLLIISCLLIIVVSVSVSANPLQHHDRNNPNASSCTRNCSRHRTLAGNMPAYTGQGMARQFVVAHNMIRKVYNEEPLEWNRTLARYARHWALQRVNDCKLQHSPNSPYGENMFWSLRGHWTPADVVKCWGDEYRNYQAATNQCTNDKACGHYTQIVWKSTKRVGCGRIQCSDNKGFLYVCSYDPPGNYYNQGPFGDKF